MSAPGDSSLDVAHEEIEALKSIYGDEMKEDQLSAGAYTIEVPLPPDMMTTSNGSKNSNAVEVGFSLPPDYPQSPPRYFIRASFLRRDTISSIVAALQKLFHDAVAEGEDRNFVFTAVEWLRENVASLLSGAIDAAADGDPSNANNDEGTINGEGDGKSPIEIYHGESIVDRKSRFVAHVAHVRDRSEVSTVIAELFRDKKIATATHNIVAYRIDSGNGGAVDEHRDDDGESGAGEPLIHLMKSIGALNLVVIVTRWFGGIELGPDRFKHINQAAKVLLLQVMQADQQQRDDEETRRRSIKMKSVPEVIARLKHDPSYSASLDAITVGYLVGADGLREMPLPQVLLNEVTITHLVQYFKLHDDIIWDKRTHVDRIFGSGSHGGDQATSK